MRISGYAKQIDANYLKLSDDVTKNGYHVIGFFAEEDDEEPMQTMCITKQRWEELDGLKPAQLATELLKTQIHVMTSSTTGKEFYMAGRDGASMEFAGKAIKVK